MSRNLRLSQKEFAALRGVLPISRHESTGLTAKKQKPRTSSAICRAVSTASYVALISGNGVLDLRFTGARLATLNDLFAMSYEERRLYRKAWHRLVFAVAMERFRGTPPQFDRARVSVLRVGPRQVDPDNIVPKAPIDALRYAGMLADDTAQVVCHLDISQQIGAYEVAIRISPEMAKLIP